MFVEVVEYDAGIGISLEFDDNAHAISVAFIPQIGDAFNAALVDHIGNFFDQCGLIGLVRQLSDDNGFAIRATSIFLGFNGSHPSHGD